MLLEKSCFARNTFEILRLLLAVDIGRLGHSSPPHYGQMHPRPTECIRLLENIEPDPDIENRGQTFLQTDNLSQRDTYKIAYLLQRIFEGA
jgi:hypothetical protein